MDYVIMYIINSCNTEPIWITLSCTLSIVVIQSQYGLRYHVHHQYCNTEPIWITLSCTSSIVVIQSQYGLRYHVHHQ